MHALKMLHRKLKEAIGMHETRLRSLVAAVGALIEGRQATVSGLGRHSGGSEYVRHRIKRMDRLLSNPHVHAASEAIYRSLAQWMIQPGAEVVLVVDWSDLTADQSWQVLRAGLPVRGRTLTVLEEVHPQKNYGKARVHRAFLARLARIVPAGVRPIIVTDAGFKTPWWRAVSAQGWRWLGRVRGREFICRQGSRAWQPWAAQGAHASARPTDLGPYLVVRSRPTEARLVLYKQPAQRRHAKTVFGKRRRGRRSAKNARAAKEPWLLAASPELADKTAAEIVALYRGRMQIEESFRDLKSAEFGLGFECHGTRKRQRLATLLLIAALALWLLWLIGQMAAEPAIAAKLRPSARRTSLSRIRLALDWCADHAPYISAAALKAGLLDLARYSAALAAGRA